MTFDQFTTKLKLLASDCSFKDADRIVFGVGSQSPRKADQRGREVHHGLCGRNWTELRILTRTVTIAGETQYNTVPVHAVNYRTKGHNSHRSAWNQQNKKRQHAYGEQRGGRSGHKEKNNTQRQSGPSDVDSNCGNCGHRHNRSESCPANTGSQVNVIPSTPLPQICPNQTLNKASKTLSAYNDTPIKTRGQCDLKCKYKGGTRMAFYVAGTTFIPILGLKSCLDLELINLICRQI